MALKSSSRNDSGMAKASVHAGTDKTLRMFGAAVRDLRKQQGLSQEAFADLVGVDRSYMGGIERGEHNVALINIQRIATALDLKISALMEHSHL